MLKITFSFLRDPIFQDALRRLYSNPDMPIGVSYKVSKLCSTIQTELDTANKLWTDIVHNHAEKNPDGSIVQDPVKGPGFFKIQEDKAELFSKKAEEFNKQEVSVQQTPLRFNDIQAVKMAPAHLDVLMKSGLLVEGDTPKAIPMRSKRPRR